MESFDNIPTVLHPEVEKNVKVTFIPSYYAFKGC